MSRLHPKPTTPTGGSMPEMPVVAVMVGKWIVDGDCYVSFGNIGKVTIGLKG